MSSPGSNVWYIIRHNVPFVLSVLILSLNFFTFGFDGSLISGLLAMGPFARQFGSGHGPDGAPALTARDISLITALPTIGSLIGVPLVWSSLGNRLGRRNMLLIACGFDMVGTAIQIAAPEIGSFIVGRALVWAAVWLFIVLSGPFLAEISPTDIRGAVTGLSIVLIDAAAIVAQGINYAFSTTMKRYAYQIPLGIQLAVGFALFFGILYLDETPTFYLAKDKDEQALDSLRRIRRGYDETSIAAEFATLRAQAKLNMTQKQAAVTWRDLFKGTDLRRTYVATSIAVMQQLSGIAFATNYVTIFLKSVGGDVSAFTLAMAVAVLAFAGAITGLLVIDKTGRRTLALSTFIAIAVIDLIIGIMGFLPLNNPAVPKTIAAFSCMFAFFFAAGFGPLTYVVASEVPTARLRDKSNAFTFLCVLVSNIIVVFVLPYIADADEANLGPKTYLIFFGWMVGCIILTFVWLPETKGRTPAEIDEMFAARIPARKFKDYVSVLTVENFKSEKDGGAAVVIEEVH